MVGTCRALIFNVAYGFTSEAWLTKLKKSIHHTLEKMDELSQNDYSSRNISNIKNKKRRQELYQKLKHEQQKAKSKLRKAKKKLIEEKGR